MLAPTPFQERAGRPQGHAPRDVPRFRVHGFRREREKSLLTHPQVGKLITNGVFKSSELDDVRADVAVAEATERLRNVVSTVFQADPMAGRSHRKSWTRLLA